MYALEDCARLTVVIAVHDTGVVEHDVHTAPAIETLDHGLHVGFFGDIAFHRVDSADHVRGHFLCFVDCFGQGRFGDIGHQHGSSFAEEEDGRFEADAAGNGVRMGSTE